MAQTLHKPIKILKREMDSDEVGWWMAYFAVEPFGVVRDDIRTAMLAAVICNNNPNRRKNSRPASIEDFMLFSEKHTNRKKNVAEKFMAYTRAYQKLFSKETNNGHH